jgi:hypothetical protein
MSEKKFSLKRLAGDVGGSAVQGATTGAVTAALVPDPTGYTILIMSATGAVVGVAGGTVGSLWGVMTDDPYGEPSMGSAALFSSVVGLAISTVLLFSVILLGDGRIDMDIALIVIVFLSSVLSTAGGFLIEDINARKRKEKESEKDWL